MAVVVEQLVIFVFDHARPEMHLGRRDGLVVGWSDTFVSYVEEQYVGDLFYIAAKRLIVTHGPVR